MTETDDRLQRATSATARAIRNREQGSERGRIGVYWIDDPAFDPEAAAASDGAPWMVVNPDVLARRHPEIFARYLRSGNAKPEDWEFARLLPKHMRPPRPLPELTEETPDDDTERVEKGEA